MGNYKLLWLTLLIAISIAAGCASTEKDSVVSDKHTSDAEVDGGKMLDEQELVDEDGGESVDETVILYKMPEESVPHEGTWLQWPHHYQYGKAYRNSLDATWVTMTKELVSSEKVHIIAYDESEKNRIISLLNAENISMTNVDFKIYKTDDVWIRDNGPIFVRDRGRIRR